MVLNELHGDQGADRAARRMAALTEPLAVGVHAVAKSGIAGRRRRTRHRSRAGRVGRASRSCGCAASVRSSPPTSHRKRAGSGRAARRRRGRRPGRRARPIEAWRRVDGTRPLVIFEAVGVPGMIEQAMRMAPKGRPDPRRRRVHAAGPIHPMLGIGTRARASSSRSATSPHEFGAALTAIADGQRRPRAVAHRQASASTGVPQAFADLGQPRSPRQDPRRADMTDATRSHDAERHAERHVPAPVRTDPAADAGRATQHHGVARRRRVVFPRSARGSDPVNCLWVLDAAHR